MVRQTQLSRFEVVGSLGAGAMGLVQRAYDPQLRREVALKRINAQAVGPRRRQRLLREARTLAQLSHPNVVEVYDVGACDGEVFIAMQLIDGVNLDAWLAAGRSVRSILRVFRQAAHGLQEAHRLGIVHRDFKPANVMVGHDGTARVVDFGLAVSDGASIAPSTTGGSIGTRGELTGTDAVVGTPAFMSPEQQQGGQRIDARTDQYAFAVALYKALFGALPFATESVDGMLIAKRRGPPPIPTTIRVPARIRRALRRALARRPSDRFPDMAGFAAELQISRRRGHVALAVATAAVVFAVGMGVAARSPTEPCLEPQRRAEATWNPARARAIATALSATGSPHARATWAVAEPRLRSAVQRWTDVATRVCIAPAAAARDERARATCLDRAHAGLAATIDVLEHPTAETIPRTADMIAVIPRAQDCLEPTEFAAPAPPLDPETRVAVDRTRQELAKVQALARAARYEDANAVADALIPGARDLGYVPLVAEVLLVQGRLATDARHADVARSRFEEAYFAARGAGHDRVAYEGALFRAGWAALEEPSVRTHWISAAAALIEEVEPDALARAPLAIDRAQAAMTAGDVDEARRELHFAVAVLEARAGHDDARLIRPLELLTNQEAQVGNTALALGYARRALALAAAAYGPQHGRVAKARSSLGQLLATTGKLEEAREQLETARAVTEEAFGPEHPELAEIYRGLGMLAHLQERGTDAKHWFVRAVAVAEATYGPDSPAIPNYLAGLAATTLELGDAAAAAAMCRRALALTEPGRPLHTNLLGNLAAALQTLGQATEASSLREQALAAAADKNGDVATHGFLLGSRGRAARDEGRYADAAVDFVHAVTLRERRLGPTNPALLPDLRDAADALRKAGNPDEAARYQRRIDELERR